jgi:rare lipoprotein A (peptidoglycan hydrolase)
MALLFLLSALPAASLAIAGRVELPPEATSSEFTRIRPDAFGPPPAVVRRSPTAASTIADFRGSLRSLGPRPQPDIEVAPRVTVVGPVVGRSNRVGGTASWYCQSGVSACHHDYAGGMYAAAGPALRVGDWRGRYVRVCGSGTCVVVRLIDWCACPSRAIDLYSDAFRRLAPLSEGTIPTTISW